MNKSAVNKIVGGGITTTLAGAGGGYAALRGGSYGSGGSDWVEDYLDKYKNASGSKDLNSGRCSQEMFARDVWNWYQQQYL